MKTFILFIVVGFALSACIAKHSPKSLQPDKSYVTTKVIGQSFVDTHVKFSMREYYRSMGFNKTDLEDAISAEGYWCTNEQLAVFGDGGIPSVLLEKAANDLSFSFFVSRFELDYVDHSIIRLIDGRWTVISTRVEKSDYFQDQLRAIKLNGKKIHP